MASAEIESAPQFAGEPEAATLYLTSLLNRNLHVHISDGRKFVGQLKCTDRDRNLILSCTQEYRQPTNIDIERAAKRLGAAGKESKVKVDMPRRFVGLVVVPGEHIKKIEVEG